MLQEGVARGKHKLITRVILSRFYSESESGIVLSTAPTKTNPAGAVLVIFSNLHANNISS